MKNVKGRMLRKGMVFCLGLVLVSAACTKLDEGSVNGNSQLQVRLTDAPGDFEAVYIDVEDVLIHHSVTDIAGDDDGGWEQIEGVKSGVYDLLKLVNGKDTLLVDANVPSGHFARLRLVLGDENRVETADSTYALHLTEEARSGIDLEIGGELRNDATFTLLLDMDVARSVARTDSTYLLNPTLRVLTGTSGGTVRGVASPSGAHIAVMAITGSDTLGTYTDTLGNYLLKEVPPGDYLMRFIPQSSSGLEIVDTAGIIINEGEISQVNVTLPDTLSNGGFQQAE